MLVEETLIQISPYHVSVELILSNIEGSANWVANRFEPDGYGNVGRSIRQPSAIESKLVRDTKLLC